MQTTDCNICMKLIIMSESVPCPWHDTKNVYYVLTIKTPMDIFTRHLKQAYWTVQYNANNKNYFMEQYQRVDSIIPDSLKFKTRLGRTVYGGGGINPDFIVNRDTSLSFSKINYIFSKGWISDFSLLYSEKHQKN